MISIYTEKIIRMNPKTDTLICHAFI